MIEDANPETTIMYDSILMPTDGSDAAENAFEHAVCQARAHDAKLVILAVVEMAGTAAPESRSDEAAEARESTRRTDVDPLVERAETAGLDVEGVVELGVPSRVILEQATTRGVDLIVMNTHARSGVGRFLYGSITERIIRDGEMPVLAMQR